MMLEFHQLELRYEAQRLRDKREESRLLGSLEREGQLSPVVVIPAGEDGRYVLMDGYRRVRALKRLGFDVVSGMVWDEDELSALVAAHHLQQRSRAATALEEAYLVRLLRGQHGLTQAEIAQKLGRTQSWVSRRLGLVQDMPEWLQEHVRGGELSCRSAQRYLLPMARAIRADAEELARNLCGKGLSTRQVEKLYRAWQEGDQAARQLVVSKPELTLQALQAGEDEWVRPEDDSGRLVKELEKVLALSRKSARLLDRALVKGLEPSAGKSLSVTWQKLIGTWLLLEARMKEEGLCDAGPRHKADDPEAV